MRPLILSLLLLTAPVAAAEPYKPLPIPSCDEDDYRPTVKVTKPAPVVVKGEWWRAVEAWWNEFVNGGK